MGELWFGGTIYTMEHEQDTVEAVYVENGVIQAVGDEHKLRNHYKASVLEEINLQGQVMYPGFVDSHLHLVGHGEKLMRLHLAYYTSKEEVIQALSQQVRHLEAGQWLIGEGWNENQWDTPTPIHRRELDLISTEHPIMLSRVCRHALLANSKAMELAGITEQTSHPQGGKIERDANGLTGLFLDTAQDLIKKAMPSFNQSYIEHAIQLAVEDLLRHGIVGGHTEDLAYYGSFDQTYKAFKNIISEDKIKFRTHLLVHHDVIENMQHSGIVQDTDFVECGAMKVFSDGALGGRTAWLSEPYQDDHNNTGIPIHKSKDLEALVQQARNYHMPIAIHAIGDRAVEEAANVLVAYPSTSTLPDRIIHAQVMRDELYDKIKQGNIIIDIQPTFVSSDFPWVLERIGQHRESHAYPWKTFLEHGIVCAGGSDAPIEEISPIQGIQSAITRTSYLDHKVYGEEQRLTPFEAVSLYTTAPAQAIGQANRKGQIQEGYTADFTILDRDLFTIDPENMLQVSVTKTVVDGTIMYENI